jgi:hypothetical protein
MSDTSRKLIALMKLAVARQAVLDEAGQQVYLEGLQQIPAEIVERACVALAGAERDDYQSAFPTLGTVITRCREMRDYLESLNAPKQLREARPVPLSAEEAKAWIARLKVAVAERRRGHVPS